MRKTLLKEEKRRYNKTFSSVRHSVGERIDDSQGRRRGKRETTAEGKEEGQLRERTTRERM
jgi:hypothetical protein